jgi:hypothetical protein
MLRDRDPDSYIMAPRPLEQPHYYNTYAPASGGYGVSYPDNNNNDVEQQRQPLVTRQQSTTAATTTTSDDLMSATIGFLICLAFLFLLVFILSYPVSSAYHYDPSTARHNIYFHANPAIYPYAP